MPSPNTHLLLFPKLNCNKQVTTACQDEQKLGINNKKRKQKFKTMNVISPHKSHRIRASPEIFQHIGL